MAIESQGFPQYGRRQAIDTATAAEIDIGLRRYMLKVYNFMAAGLGVTIHVGNGCRSSSCVSVYAPGYGSYHGGRPARLHKAHKDAAQVASVARKDDSAATPAATAPAAAATPEAPPQAAPQPAASDATPANN